MYGDIHTQLSLVLFVGKTVEERIFQKLDLVLERLVKVETRLDLADEKERKRKGEKVEVPNDVRVRLFFKTFL